MKRHSGRAGDLLAAADRKYWKVSEGRGIIKRWPKLFETVLAFCVSGEKGEEMLATLDLAAVRRFTADLNERLRRCDTGEGMECSTLESSINHYARLCEEMQQGVRQWALGVFSGEASLDAAVETLLKQETRLLVNRAKRVAERGRTTEGPCYYFEELDRLYRCIQELDDMLADWVTPQLAVAAGPRTRIPEETENLIKERLAKLSPLPSDWQPTDPDQSAFFRRQSKK